MKFKWNRVVWVVVILLAAWWLRQATFVAATTAQPPQVASTNATQSATSSSIALMALGTQSDNALSAGDTAHGEIHFTRSVTNEPAQQLDLNVRYGLGVWLPRDNLVRVLLLTRPLAANEVERLTPAIADGTISSSLATTYALLTLHFQPTAQAFDRNDLDTAQLTLSDNQGTVSADILGSLEWRGSLPSRQVADERNTTTLLELSSSGHGQSDAPVWYQSWRFDTAVPIKLID